MFLIIIFILLELKNQKNYATMKQHKKIFENYFKNISFLIKHNFKENKINFENFFKHNYKEKYTKDKYYNNI
jgi:hypothetical protein